MRVRIKEYINVVFEEDSIQFISDFNSGVNIPKNELSIDLIDFLRDGAYSYDNLECLLSNKYELDASSVRVLLDMLFRLKVIEYYNDEDLNLLDLAEQKQVLYIDYLQPEDEQKKSIYKQIVIKEKNIVILGTGGIGSYAILSMLGAGIRNLILIDGDIVEESNLNRQFFFNSSDIGKYKTKVIKQKIQDDFSCNVTDFNVQISSKNKLYDILVNCGKIDFLFFSADTPRDIYLWVDELAKELKYTYIRACYFGAIGLVGPVVNEKYKNSRIENYRINIDNKNYDSSVKFKHVSVATNNAIIANVAVNEMMKFLYGIPSVILGDSMLVIDLLKYQFYVSKN